MAGARWRLPYLLLPLLLGGWVVRNLIESGLLSTIVRLGLRGESKLLGLLLLLLLGHLRLLGHCSLLRQLLLRHRLLHRLLRHLPIRELLVSQLRSLRLLVKLLRIESGPSVVVTATPSSSATSAAASGNVGDTTERARDA